jgi:hypothetical protein
MSTGPSSLLLAAALVLAGAYAAVTATFNKSYDMTTCVLQHAACMAAAVAVLFAP